LSDAMPLMAAYRAKAQWLLDLQQRAVGLAERDTLREHDDKLRAAQRDLDGAATHLRLARQAVDRAQEH